jgi:hypothetical protein
VSKHPEFSCTWKNYGKICHFYIPYFFIDNARIIYTKSLNSLKMNMRGIHLKGKRGKSNVRWKYYLIFIEHWTIQNILYQTQYYYYYSTLLKNSSVLCMYFLALPLVCVCTLSIHQKERWKCWGAHYLSKNMVVTLKSFSLHLFTYCLVLLPANTSSAACTLRQVSLQQRLVEFVTMLHYVLDLTSQCIVT